MKEDKDEEDSDQTPASHREDIVPQKTKDPKDPHSKGISCYNIQGDKELEIWKKDYDQRARKRL